MRPVSTALYASERLPCAISIAENDKVVKMGSVCVTVFYCPTVYPFGEDLNSYIQGGA